MNSMSKNSKRLRTSLIALSATMLLYPLVAETAQAETRPAFVITHEPIPAELKKKPYNKPVRLKDIKASDIKQAYYNPTETLVTRKVKELSEELNTLQGTLVTLSDALNTLQRENENRATDYYAAIATVNTQLQSGTTPGNPRLINKISRAESNLEQLSASITDLNQLGARAAGTASEASFLLESTRATYSLSGAIEEDHIKLAELEDAINNTIVIIERILNNVNDDITRTTSYLNSERNNLRTLSLAVTKGDLYGKSLSNHPFSNASQFDGEASAALSQDESYTQAIPLLEPRPLVKIRFDRTNVKYEQPVYMAVNEALERYPDARFDLIAVHPTQGNAAEVAIESTRARRNAERVLRTLTQMGLPLERISLSYSESADASTNEVHLYVR